MPAEDILLTPDFVGGLKNELGALKATHKIRCSQKILIAITQYT